MSFQMKGIIFQQTAFSAEQIFLFQFELVQMRRTNQGEFFSVFACADILGMMSHQDDASLVEQLEAEVAKLKRQLDDKNDLIVQLQQQLSGDDIKIDNSKKIDDYWHMKSNQLRFTCVYNSNTTTVQQSSIFPFAKTISASTSASNNSKNKSSVEIIPSSFTPPPLFNDKDSNCDNDDDENVIVNDNKQYNYGDEKTIELICFGYLRRTNVVFPNDIADNILSKYLIDYSINVRFDLFNDHGFQTVIFDPSIETMLNQIKQQREAKNIAKSKSKLNSNVDSISDDNDNIIDTDDDNGIDKNDGKLESGRADRLEINMRMTLLSNECNSIQFGNDGYNMAIGIIGVPKDVKHFLFGFKHLHPEFCTLHSIMQRKMDWENIQSDYLFATYYRNDFHCFFGKDATVGNLKLYNNLDYDRYKPIYNPQYCFKSGDSCDVVIEKYIERKSGNNNNNTNADNENNNNDNNNGPFKFAKQFVQAIKGNMMNAQGNSTAKLGGSGDGENSDDEYCMSFRKHGRSCIGEDIQFGEYANGKINLDFSKYNYYFAMSANTCNCRNVRGFEYNFDFFSPTI